MSSNRLLSNLSRQDFALLEPHLEAIDLPLRKRLEKPNRRIDHVYFINAGFASVVANGSNKPIEVGLIGREGMTGLSIVLGDVERTANETYMQAAGAGQRMSAGKLRDAIANSRSLHRNLLRYAHAFLIQTTSTALANGRSKSEEP
jgi:CRP-like cAMP-binding protein